MGGPVVMAQACQTQSGARKSRSASFTISGCSRLTRCPASSTSRKRAPGMAAASSRPISGPVTASSSPGTTRVGTLIGGGTSVGGGGQAPRGAGDGLGSLFADQGGDLLDHLGPVLAGGLAQQLGQHDLGDEVVALGQDPVGHLQAVVPGLVAVGGGLGVEQDQAADPVGVAGQEGQGTRAAPAGA